MSFVLIMQEKTPSGSYPCWTGLDMDREVVYHIYRITHDQWQNEYKTILLTTDCIHHARKFLKSCRLIGGIEIE